MFRQLFITLILFAAVSAFEKGHHDQVATVEQTQELLRQAFGDSNPLGGLRVGRGGSYDVIVLGANETFPDEDLYEDLEESEERGPVERHAKSKGTYQTDMHTFRHLQMTYPVSFACLLVCVYFWLVCCTYRLVLRQGW